MSSNKELKISKNIQKWEDVIVGLFPRAIPNKCTWDDNIDMLNVLFSICYKNLNSIYYPDGKVHNLFGVDFSQERGCIELITENTIDIVKPINLTFYFCDDEYSWSYFRLETAELQSILDSYDEEVYSENLPDSLNGEQNRYLKKSSFLIFPKESPFSSLYNKDYNALSAEELRIMIDEFIIKQYKD